jgi:hypothetical protein
MVVSVRRALSQPSASISCQKATSILGQGQCDFVTNVPDSLAADLDQICRQQKNDESNGVHLNDLLEVPRRPSSWTERTPCIDVAAKRDRNTRQKRSANAPSESCAALCISLPRVERQNSGYPGYASNRRPVVGRRTFLSEPCKNADSMIAQAAYLLFGD